MQIHFITTCRNIPVTPVMDSVAAFKPFIPDMIHGPYGPHGQQLPDRPNVKEPCRMSIKCMVKTAVELAVSNAGELHVVFIS